jgi:hypothetical protein
VKLRDPRVHKTAQTMLLALFGFWLGGLDARAAHDTFFWVGLVLCLIGFACTAYGLLRDVWKSPA